jgi:hypothetical protein
VPGRRLCSPSFNSEPHAISSAGGLKGALVKRAARKLSAEGALLSVDCSGTLDAVLGRVGPAGGKVLVPKTDIGGPVFIDVIADTAGTRSASTPSSADLPAPCEDGGQMTRLAVLAVVLAVPHPLTSDAVATRQAAAVSWSAKHGAVKLPWPDALTAGDGATDCVELRAPAPARCAKSVWACPVESASATCTGDFNAERRLVFVESDGPPGDAAFSAAHAAQGVGVLVRAESGNDAPELECAGAVGFGVAPGVSAEQRARAEAEWREQVEREHQKCLREAKARNVRAAMQLRCELLMVNPCRREAFVRCAGKNLGEAPDETRPGVARVTWTAPESGRGQPLRP